MRFLQRLLLLSPLLLLAATCVTETRQRGPLGPWVGEVVNNSDETVAEVTVHGQVFDATGRPVGFVSAFGCPSQLAPGERATFELFPPYVDGVVPPLRAEIESQLFSYPAPDPSPYSSDGLTVRQVGQAVARRFVLVELHNNSAFTYSSVTVCANLRTPSGTLAEVGTTSPFPPSLRPGESQTFPIFFNSMPQGSFEFDAHGQRNSFSGVLTLPRDRFHVTASKVLESLGRKFFRVVGEFTNMESQDLFGVALSAHVSDSWADRIDGATLSCGGQAAHGDTVPATFFIPFAGSIVRPSLSVEAVGTYGSGKPLYTIPTSDIVAEAARTTPDGQLETRRVSATLTNGTSGWIVLQCVCLSLRDGSGRLVGTTDDIDRISDVGPARYGYLAPGATFRVTANVEQLDASVSAEALAYALPLDGPPPAPISTAY